MRDYFDFNNDGKLDACEESVKCATILRILDDLDEEEKKNDEYNYFRYNDCDSDFDTGYGNASNSVSDSVSKSDSKSASDNVSDSSSDSEYDTFSVVMFVIKTILVLIGIVGLLTECAG